MSTLNSGRPVVVCCADKNMEAGLHVTLYSMLVNLTAKQTGVRLHLFLEGFSPADVKLLRATMDAAAVEYELCLNQISLDKFQGFRSLHGNYMTYARLLLPGILAGEDRFLYLDSDLVVGTDVAALFQTEMQHRPIAAAGGQDRGQCPGKTIFSFHRIARNQPLFQRRSAVV